MDIKRKMIGILIWAMIISIMALSFIVVSASAVTVDNFNRTNSASLGTAYNGFTWAESENAQCTYSIDSGQLVMFRERRIGSANISIGASAPGNSTFTILARQTANGEHNVLTLYNNGVTAFSLGWHDGAFKQQSGNSQGVELYSPPSTNWEYNITLVFNTTNNSVDGLFNGTKRFNRALSNNVNSINKIGMICDGATDDLQTGIMRVNGLFYNNGTIFQYVVPVINVTDPANNSVFNKSMENLTYASFCLDSGGSNFSLQMKNSSGIVASVHNASFFNGVSLLNGHFNLENISTGEYSLNFSCRNVVYSTEVEIVSNVTETAVNVPAINITPHYPLTSSNVSLLSVPFNLSVNMSSSCMLLINGTSYGLRDIPQGVIWTHSNQTLFNGTFEYFYSCNITTFVTNSSPILFNVLEPYLSNPAPPANDSAVNTGTDLTGLVDAFVLFIFLLLAFGVIAAGKMLKSPITGIIGCFVLMFASFFAAPYSASIALCLILMALLLIWYFIRNGQMQTL